MKHEIVSKDYSAYVNISKYKDRNPNKNIRSCFSTSEIALLWKHKNDPYCQTILMLIYNGVRVSELLDLKKENVHLSEQYFDVIDSKPKTAFEKFRLLTKYSPFTSTGFMTVLIVNISSILWTASILPIICITTMFSSL